MSGDGQYTTYRKARHAYADGTGSLAAMTALVTPEVAARISAAERDAARHRREARADAERETARLRDERWQVMADRALPASFAVIAAVILVLLAGIGWSAQVQGQYQQQQQAQRTQVQQMQALERMQQQVLERMQQALQDQGQQGG